MANKRFIDFPIATTVGDNDIILIWQGGANKQTTKATILSGVPDSLNDLTDVTISGLTNGQILRYDSVTGQWENTDQGNLDLNDLNDVTIVSPTNGQVLVYNSSTGKWENSSGGYVPYVGAVTTVNLGAQSIQAGSFVKQGGTASQFLKADGSVDSTAYGTGSVTSVGLTMPAAFNVANSPITTSGTLAVTGAGTVGQYIRGDGSLADFPQSSGGGSSVSYYLNGSVDQGTIGGIAYKELSKVPILGAGTDFTINADGYIASFITDAGDPSLLEIPGGNWNFETYFSASSGGGSPTFYVELYKVSSGGTATLIASSSSAPELIAFGTNLNPYFSTLAVPTTTLALTDRLAVRYYVTHSGRTITLHTENNHLCQIVTTFTTGITALNGLTAQVQNFAVGTTGTDFNIASATATHTFNLPTASATNRGALSSADWSLFTQAYNDKINSAAVTGTTTKTLTLTQQDGGTITASWSDLNTDAVLSVFGRTGAVVAANGDYTTAQVTESGNLYYTDARSRAALSFAAGSGAYNTSTGVITIPTNNNQIANGAGYITSAALSGYLPLSGGVMTGPITTPNGTFGIIIGDDSRLADRNIANTLFVEGNQNNDRGYINFSQTSGNDLGAINGGNLTWRGNTVWHSGNINPVTSVTASSPLASSGGTTPNITIQQASGSQSGFLSSTDWTTFNNKQNALTNPVTGTGTTNYLPKFTGSTTIGNSSITDTGSLVTFTTLLRQEGQYIQIVNSTNPSLYINNNVVQWQNYVKSNYNLAFSDAVRDVLTLGYNGSPSFFQGCNLLVGTTSDNGARLQVSGAGNTAMSVGGNGYSVFTGSAFSYTPNNIGLSLGYNRSGGNGESTIVWGAPAAGFNFEIASVTSGTITPRLTIASTGAATFSSNVAASLFSGNLTVGSATVGGQVKLDYGANAASRSWRLVSDAYNYGDFSIQQSTTQAGLTYSDKFLISATGNVGIGTPSPSEKLDVVGGGLAAGNGTIKTGITYSSLGLIGTFSNHDLGILTNGSIKATITSGGNVLIGTTSDNGARLQVSGGGWFEANTPIVSIRGTGSGEFGLRILDASATLGGLTYSSITGEQRLNGQQSYVFQTIYAGGSERLRVTSSGNVGIGTPSPAALTEINPGNITNGGAAKFALAIRSGGTTYLDFYQGWNSTIAGQSILGTTLVSSDALAFASSGVERMRITSGGDILVAGSYNPYASTNRGNITLNGTSSNILAFTNNSAGRGYILHDGTDIEITNLASGQLQFFVASGEAFRVLSTKGILTYADLAVGGKINGFDLTTLAPTGTNNVEWRLGRALVATSVETEDRWIRVQLGNRIYDILAIDRGLA